MKTFGIVIGLLSVVVSYGQTYHYPVKLGSNEWRKLNSTAEKLAVCQLPDSVLKTSSTKDLLLTCLSYPLLNNYTASNSPYEGFLNVIGSFNGLTEFLERSDADQVLLDYYLAENLSIISNKDTEIDKGGYAFVFLAEELLLSHEKIMDKFSQKEQKEFLKALLLKYEQKSHFQEYFGFYGKMTTAFVGI